MMKHIVSYSGGLNSFAVAERVIAKHGVENTICVFTDTKSEDEDLYRFIDETIKHIRRNTVSETKWACPCMETIYQNLKKRIGTDKLYFTNTREFGSITSGKVVSKPEPLRIAFEVKGKNGKPLSKLKTSFVSFDYCPFCGEKYGEIK